MNNWKKVFAIIWTGQFFSILTSSIVNFAIVLWLSFETKSAEVLALATIMAMLPQSVLGLFTGIFVDRWKRKRVMILADSFIAFCTLILAVLFYLDIAKIGHIYLLLALRSVGSAFHMPAMQASVPLLAPKSELIRIAGINQIIQSICNIAGPALAALFISFMKMTNILMLDVIGAALACTSLLFVTIPDPDNTERTQKVRLLKEAKEAFTEVRRQNGLSFLFLLSILGTFFIMPVSVLYPLMTLNHYSGNAFQISLVEVAWGIGALLGGTFLGMKKFRLNEISLINWMYILLGFTFVLSGILPVSGYPLFVLLTAVGGISGSLYGVFHDCRPDPYRSGGNGTGVLFLYECQYAPFHDRAVEYGFSGRYDRDRKHFYDRWRIGRADWSCLVLYSLNRRFKKQLPEIEYAGLVQRN